MTSEIGDKLKYRSPIIYVDTLYSLIYHVNYLIIHIYIHNYLQTHPFKFPTDVRCFHLPTLTSRLPACWMTDDNVWHTPSKT